jgi:hypothetical protein
MSAETALAHWRSADVEYGVAAIDDGRVLVIVVAAIGPGDRQRTAHLFRPPNTAELAGQVAQWNTSTDEERTAAAELLLGSA